jgi:hypothetical protein
VNPGEDVPVVDILRALRNGLHPRTVANQFDVPVTLVWALGSDAGLLGMYDAPPQ